MAKLHRGSESDLSFLAEVLRSGGLVAVPTETVYGLAANALDPAACARIFEAKGRPRYDPFIVHVLSRAAAGELAEFNAAANTLAARFWPGPLTLVLPKKPAVPDIVTADRPTVALRMPAHPLMRALLERCGLPLAAPSANAFGTVSPTTAAHVQDGLGDRIEHILDGGPCVVGVESTIVDARDHFAPVILRAGGVSREAIEAALGRPVRLHARPAARPPSAAGGELAPGLLDRHYSPRTPLEIRGRPFTADELARKQPGVARVCFRRPVGPAGEGIFWLSETGDASEAAHRLFALMRQLDGEGFRQIVFEPAPTAGLGLAINDRLRRAAGPTAGR